MNRNRRDGHHILYNRMEWRQRPEGLALREQPSLIMTIDRRTHEEIHRECPAVPVLGYHALCRTVRNYHPGEDELSSMDNLLFAIEDSLMHPRAHRLERQLGLLVIEGIEVQRPFIKEGIMTSRSMYV